MSLAFFISLALHYSMSPWSLFPEHTLELKDPEGEISIDTDLLNDQPEAPPPQDVAPAQTDPNTPGPGPKINARDAGVEEAKDGGEDLDAAIEDSGTEVSDAEVAMVGDASVMGANGPRDPNALIGAAGSVQAGPSLVQLLVNMEVIRKNPIGAQMGPMLSAIPQWDEFIAGTNVDAVRDTDWVFISGPSLIHTDRDAIFVHYSTTDAVVDHAIDIVAHKYDRGGYFDAGVPGVKATLGHADRAQRVFLRPQSHLLVVVPPDYAHTAANMLLHVKISPHLRPTEAMRLTLATPWHVVPALPQSMTELRLWIIPRADGGADANIEIDCTDAAAAIQGAEEVKKIIRQQNSLGVRMLTNGVLNGFDVSVDGSMVRARLPVSRDQLETLLGLVASQLGVTLPEQPAPPH
ncbi:MAG: hypothetical protein ABI461_01325 [Polyangiaceae bacterium]